MHLNTWTQRKPPTCCRTSEFAAELLAEPTPLYICWSRPRPHSEPNRPLGPANCWIWSITSGPGPNQRSVLDPVQVEWLINQSGPRFRSSGFGSAVSKEPGVIWPSSWLNRTEGVGFSPENTKIFLKFGSRLVLLVSFINHCGPAGGAASPSTGVSSDPESVSSLYLRTERLVPSKHKVSDSFTNKWKSHLPGHANNTEPMLKSQIVST